MQKVGKKKAAAAEKPYDVHSPLAGQRYCYGAGRKGGVSLAPQHAISHDGF